MGVLIAAIVFAAGAIGAGAKQGVFKKGYDTTYRDTLAFERNALDATLARTESKERRVVELTGAGDATGQRQARLDSKEKRLEARIARIDRKLAQVD